MKIYSQIWWLVDKELVLSSTHYLVGAAISDIESSMIALLFGT